jgi:hypothetical protein
MTISNYHTVPGSIQEDINELMLPHIPHGTQGKARACLGIRVA